MIPAPVSRKRVPRGSLKLRNSDDHPCSRAICCRAVAVRRPASWTPPAPSNSGNRPMIRFVRAAEFSHAHFRNTKTPWVANCGGQTPAVKGSIHAESGADHPPDCPVESAGNWRRPGGAFLWGPVESHHCSRFHLASPARSRRTAGRAADTPGRTNRSVSCRSLWSAGSSRVGAEGKCAIPFRRIISHQDQASSGLEDTCRFLESHSL